MSRNLPKEIDETYELIVDLEDEYNAWQTIANTYSTLQEKKDEVSSENEIEAMLEKHAENFTELWLENDRHIQQLNNLYREAYQTFQEIRKDNEGIITPTNQEHYLKPLEEDYKIDPPKRQTLLELRDDIETYNSSHRNIALRAETLSRTLDEEYGLETRIGFEEPEAEQTLAQAYDEDQTRVRSPLIFKKR